LAGAWIAAVAGFGGMRDHDGELSFIPRLPDAITRLNFRITFRNRRLAVEVVHEQATYTLVEGPSLEITHHGERATIEPDAPVTLSIPKAPMLEPPTQPPGRAPAKRRKPARTSH
jgi:alpha,alpha-trehalose phosphorylase